MILSLSRCCGSISVLGYPETLVMLGCNLKSLTIWQAPLSLRSLTETKLQETVLYCLA